MQYYNAHIHELFGSRDTEGRPLPLPGPISYHATSFRVTTGAKRRRKTFGNVKAHTDIPRSREGGGTEGGKIIIKGDARGCRQCVCVYTCVK